MMAKIDESTIGLRIKLLRRLRGLSQQELADTLGKSLRTVQKYETGEIEVSISMINQLSEVLNTTPIYLLGYDSQIDPIRNLADVMNFLFHINRVEGLDFRIDVRRPPHYDEWECSLTFNGKNKEAIYNADMCLFLEEWEHRRDDLRTYALSYETLHKWEEQILAYYHRTEVKYKEEVELSLKESVEKRKAYLNAQFSQDGDN